MINYHTIEYTTLETTKPISPSFVSNLNHKLHLVSYHDPATLQIVSLSCSQQISEPYIDSSRSSPGWDGYGGQRMDTITKSGGKTASHTEHGASLSDDIRLQRYLKTV